jgi:hypothetical protein
MNTYSQYLLKDLPHSAYSAEVLGLMLMKQIHSRIFENEQFHPVFSEKTRKGTVSPD